MTDDGQPLDPPAALERAVGEVLGPWLVRCVVATAVRRVGSCSDELRAAAAEMAGDAVPELMDDLRHLLATDVDAQRRNPLAILRSAVRYPTAVLRRFGVPPAPRDEFAERAFPDDVYGLGPATWSDVDPSLHEPGLMWGAWKAANVLRRRREEGLR